MDVVLVLSFLFFMSVFAGVGMASMFVKQNNTDDYLVAGRGMHPALAALSAVSTWNSGYMFIGFIGRLALGVVPFGAIPPTGDGLGPGLIIAAMPSNGPAGTFGLFAADPCAIAPTTIEKRLRLVCTLIECRFEQQST